MKKTKKENTSVYQSISDLFSGIMISLLLILIVIWLEALQEAMQIRRLKRTQKIFEQAFKDITSENDTIRIDPERGEIIMKAQGAFQTGVWTFQPEGEVKKLFINTRTTLANIIKDIDEKFQKIEGVSAKDHFEILIIGHTDCVPFDLNLGHSRRLEDNWDLSVLRATAISRFFTQLCNDSTLLCCEDGSQLCPNSEKSQRIHPQWRVLPAGRGPYEVTRKIEQVSIKNGECIIPERKPQIEEWLQEQRRVVVQIVPRIDKLLIQDMK